jgi:predicted component of type VI protein secretion system
MVTLRLFRTADPFQQIEARELTHGEITIGRDPGADWTINDPRRDLSRNHCVLGVDGETIFLRDTSTNGVSIGVEKLPAPYEERCELRPGETIYFGEYMMLLDCDAVSEAGHDDTPPKRETAPALTGPAPQKLFSGPVTDAALLEAFCGGAGLEASSFAGEDPAAVMNRLGVAYRQVVDDLCSLMRDRAMLKDQLQMERTTISARDNNPLKWAPPHRIAVDLLQEGEGGFLKGAEAFRASFADLRRHGACMLAGSRAAVKHMLDELSPDAIETNVKRQPLYFVAKSEAAWKHFRERHAQLAAEARNTDSDIEHAFRSGYEEHLRSMDGEEAA